MGSTQDAWMREAIAEGERGRLSAPPNPWVGCVLVREGEVVGRGHHVAPGSPHAEAAALADAGGAASGATAYVTLTPCTHHGRTPPCSLALADAGVSRVVVAVDDPDPVSGDGLAELRRAGLEVEVGVAGAQATESLRPYLHHRSTGRPLVVVKAATSLDGRVAAADGTSQWITGPEARADGHRLRAESQAVVVGAGTAVADQPSLTVRDAEVPRQAPLRVVLDGAGRVPATGPLFSDGEAPTLVFTTTGAEPAAVSAWKAAGAEVEELAPAPSGVDLEGVVDSLGRRQVLQVLVEGGPTLAGALVAAGLVSDLVVYTGGAVLGPEGAPLLAGVDVPTLGAAERWTLHDAAVLGGDARLTWRAA